MNNKDFENRLKTTLHKTENREMTDAMQKIIWKIKRDLYRRPQRERLRFTDFLSIQMQFIGWKVWLYQIFLLVLFSTVFSGAYGDYLCRTPAYAARVLCYLAILIAMTALPLLQRSIHYKMQEIEAATHFSTAQLLATKLMIIGLGDIFMLTGMLIIAATKTSLQTGSIAFCLLFPFLLASGGTLFLIGHLKANRLIPGSLGFYFLMILSIILVKQFYPGFFQQTLSGYWVAVCIGLMAFCIYQVRYLVSRSCYSEMQLN